MDKYDVKTALNRLYSAKPMDSSMVDVPEMQFLAIDGQGDPNTSPYYAQVVESLFSVAYALKFQSKTQLGRDMTVGPLEGLWWGSQEDYVRRNKGNWLWTMMVFQPDWITNEMLAAAQGKVLTKKPLSAIKDLRLTVLHTTTKAPFWRACITRTCRGTV